MSELPQAVVTDIDGVVVETEDYHRQAYNALAGELGITLHYSGEDYAARLHQVGGAKLNEVMDLLGTAGDDRAGEKVRLYARKTELFKELIVADLEKGALQTRPGVRELFEEIVEAGTVLAAASTCEKSAALAILKHSLGDSLYAALAAVCAGADSPKMKPAPDIYLLAAERCGVAPERCVAIEDSVHGMNAALAAGMRCLVTPSEYTLGGDFAGAHRVVDTLEGVTLADLAAL